MSKRFKYNTEPVSSGIYRPSSAVNANAHLHYLSSKRKHRRFCDYFQIKKKDALPIKLIKPLIKPFFHSY